LVVFMCCAFFHTHLSFLMRYTELSPFSLSPSQKHF
jgi:hypothetical protein